MIAGLAVLAACASAEGRCQHLRTDILIADLAAQGRARYGDDLRARVERDAAGRTRDSAGKARLLRSADSLDSLLVAQRDRVKMTDRAWYRRHCE
jgi:hypothetical protein